MKRKIIATLLLGIIFIFTFNGVEINGIDRNTEKTDEIQESIAGKIIRFHVIANSDSVEDQTLKLKVKDKVLEYISPKLKNCTSINESRLILVNNDKKIKKLCEDTIKQNGYTYKVATTLSHENFPVKSYGNITLPQGKYEAYRIIIGSGSGRNWWCVMFPPLCFVDVTKGEVSDKKTETLMKKTLNEKEYNIVNNDSNNKAYYLNDNKVVLKFKTWEVLKHLLTQMEYKFHQETRSAKTQSSNSPKKNIK